MSAEPFTHSLEHLLAELERLDLRLRAQVAALRGASDVDAAFRGLYIDEAEVDALLTRPMGRPRWPVAAVPVEALAALRRCNEERCLAAQREGTALRLARARTLFGLDDLACDVLLLALAVDLEPRYERLFAYLQDDVTRRRPSVGLLIDLLADAWDDRLRLRACFDAGAPLRAGGLLGLVENTPPQPLLACPVAVPRRVVDWLIGGDAVDEGLSHAVRKVPGEHGLDRLPVDAASLRQLKRLRQDAGAPRIVLLVGERGVGKHAAALAFAHESGSDLLEVDLAAVPADGGFESIATGLLREARLQGLPVFLRGADPLLEPSRRRDLERWLGLWRGHSNWVFLGARDEWEPGGELRDLPFECVRLRAPSLAERAALWRARLPQLEAAGIDAAELAGHFKLTSEQVCDAAATVLRGRARPDAGPLRVQDVHEACRRHSHAQLNVVARKITPKYRWDDIVLPADRLAMLRDICDQMKFRGRVMEDWGFGRRLAMGKGLSVLFAGPSGTGKTMAADIIAGELGLDLFKIDLAGVVSKYIGETEKNLRALFDEAETSNAVLFFDEADALFGKRTEIRDSHDRHANVETGYLLQRLEAYEGMTILATNLRKNMDEAFVRRLQFTVEFPFPTVADRRSIWQGVWPREMPRQASIDPAELGRRFEMTGGNIRNVALAAAFLAAGEGCAVGLPHVMRATQREFQKMGKLVDEAAFAASDETARAST